MPLFDHHSMTCCVTSIYCHFSAQPNSQPVVHAQKAAGKDDVTAIVQLLRTSLDKLIHGVTHSKLDLNYKGEQGMTLLHHAAMVWLLIHVHFLK